MKALKRSQACSSSAPNSAIRGNQHLWELKLTELGHLKSEFIWAYESTLLEPIRSKSYQAPGQSSFLIFKGQMEVETDAGILRVGPGNWCFPHQGRRLLRMERGGHILNVRFRTYWPGGEPLFNAPVAEVIKATKAPKLEKQARMLIREISRTLPGAKADLPWQKMNLLTHIRLLRVFDSWLYAYVETMLAVGAVPSRLAKTDPRVLKVLAWLDDLPLNHTLTEAELLAESNMSASVLTRLFSQEFAQTPHQYFENRKLTRAKMLIRSSPMAIKQISFELGYGSIQAFSRWFRKKTSQSPRQFKNGEQV